MKYIPLDHRHFLMQEDQGGLVGNEMDKSGPDMDASGRKPSLDVLQGLIGSCHGSQERLGIERNPVGVHAS